MRNCGTRMWRERLALLSVRAEAVRGREETEHDLSQCGVRYDVLGRQRTRHWTSAAPISTFTFVCGA
jgi:hypothetical protein